MLLHRAKRNEVLTLEEVEQYGLDSFGDADYISTTECVRENGTVAESVCLAVLRYDLNEKGRNQGILLGTKGWMLH